MMIDVDDDDDDDHDLDDEDGEDDDDHDDMMTRRRLMMMMMAMVRMLSISACPDDCASAMLGRNPGTPTGSSQKEGTAHLHLGGAH